jgi:small redox-active disulfide protein 2
MLTIKILGPGCANCQRLAELAARAATNMGVQAELVKVLEYKEIMKYPLLSTPGLVVNEKLVLSGRIPDESEIMTWIADAMETS